MQSKIDVLSSEIKEINLQDLRDYKNIIQKYKENIFSYQVRDKNIEVQNFHESLSGLKIPVISPPNITSWKDILIWLRQENFPGTFPYTAGIYPFKRTEEDPTRMFAGEGSPRGLTIDFII